jgi:outer membrane receptor protein involved in Fe transport
MRKLYSTPGSYCHSTLPVVAQQIISGKVTDENGNSINGASVTVKGSTAGTTTKADGTYSLSVPANAKALVITYIGMEALEIPISGKTTINASLRSEEKAMQEVVVVGYETVRKKDVTAAISKISSADIDNLPNVNLAQAMQGRAAGVIVANANGIPGGSSSVLIRGVGSVSAGSVPLYVVDGVQLNTSTGSINTQNNP